MSPYPIVNPTPPREVGVGDIRQPPLAQQIAQVGQATSGGPAGRSAADSRLQRASVARPVINRHRLPSQS